MKLALFLCSLFCYLTAVNAQDSKLKQFKQLSWPEKRWVCLHPFVAQKALLVSQEARRRSDSLLLSPLLDGDAQGGAVDAYRHAWWMACLSQTIGARKALSLGRAHERTNFREHKTGKAQGHHDEPMREMDLRNNKVGVRLSSKKEAISFKELDQRVLNAIAQGQLWVLSKDENGNYLSENGEVLPENEWQGVWYSARCLQASH